MGQLKSFEEITSWQKARILNRKIYLVTGKTEITTDPDLRRQIRRASVSITSNIAEGFERNTDKEFIHFLFIAKASAGEVRSQLYLAYDLEFIPKNHLDDLMMEITQVSQLIAGFIRYLQNKNNTVATS